MEDFGDDDDEPIAGGGSDSAASLPAATITKIIKENLPVGAHVGADVTPLVSACMIEFLEMITSQANQKANQKRKSESAMVIINESNVTDALEELGFGHIVTAVKGGSSGGGGSSSVPPPLPDGGDVAGDAALPPPPNEERKKKSKKKRGPPDSGMSQEELLRMQQELFASAKQTMDAAHGAAQ
jgi:histone H3/H4